MLPAIQCTYYQFRQAIAHAGDRLEPRDLRVLSLEFIQFRIHLFDLRRHRPQQFQFALELAAPEFVRLAVLDGLGELVEFFDARDRPPDAPTSPPKNHPSEDQPNEATTPTEQQPTAGQPQPQQKQSTQAVTPSQATDPTTILPRSTSRRTIPNLSLRMGTLWGQAYGPQYY